MTSRPCAPLLVGLTLLAGLAWGAPPTPDGGARRADDADAGAPPADGGVADGGAASSDAGVDAAAPADAALPPVALELDAPPATVDAQVRHLTALAEGKLDVTVDPRTLFAVDPADPAAVATRIATLRRSIAAARAQAAPLQARREAAALPAGPDGGPPGPPPLTEGDAARLAQLERLTTREGLRLDLLSRPVEERRALLEAHAARRALADEQVRTASARREAEAEAARAEAARQAALAEAERAQSEAARALAEARADAEALRGRFAEMEAADADRRAALLDASAARLELAHTVHTRLADSALPASEADALYGRLVDALGIARARFAESLDALHQPPTLPSVEPTLDLEAGAYRALPVVRDALVQALEAARAARARLVEHRGRLQVTTAETLARDVKALNEARLAVLPRMSAGRREAVMGFGREGLQQLARELDHLRLAARWYLRSRRDLPARAPGWLLEVLGRASTRWAAIELGLLLLGALLLLLRGGRAWTRLGALIEGWAGSRTDRAWARRLWRHVGPLTPALALLAWVALTTDVLDTLLRGPEVVAIDGLLTTYALYKLFIAFTHHLLLLAASSPGAPVDQAMSARLLRTVRVTGRYVFTVRGFLIVADVVLGRGYLFTVVQEFAWLGAFPIAWWTLRHWKGDIFHAYLRRSPGGWLAERVRRSHDRLLGWIWVLPTAALLTTGALAEGAVRMALRAGRIRRALAYLFRRRLERQAATQAVEPDVPLPPALAEVLGRGPIDPALRVDRLPGLDATVHAIEAWQRDGQGAGPVALVGERGIGKSTWLTALEERLPGDLVTHRLALGAPRITEETVCRWLAESLGLPAVTDAEGLIVALHEGPRRVVLLDDAHLMLRRAHGGAGGIEALVQILRRTGRHVFWVAAFGRFAWSYLRFLLRQPDVFRQTHRLEGWSEDALAELIDRRMAAAGVTADYVPLMPEGVAHGYDHEGELARTRERFLRLLWDYADGVPGTALHFWAASLRPVSDTVARVRLFRDPSPDDLEGLGDDARFALYAVVLHDQLSLTDAPPVLGAAPARCLALLEQLRAVGCLVRQDDRYRVPLHWYRAAVRFLRRKHLLYG